MKKYLELLEQQRFYDAHEVLEELWFPKRFEDSNEVRLLKGLINAAVSFELMVHKKREKAAKKVWLNYLKYRALLYKTETPHYREYHRAVRTVDALKRALECELRDRG